MNSSIMSILNKITIRAIVSLLTIIFFYIILIIIIIKSSFNVSIEGKIDVTILFGFLTGTLLTVVIEYLFRRS